MLLSLPQFLIITDPTPSSVLPLKRGPWIAQYGNCGDVKDDHRRHFTPPKFRRGLELVHWQIRVFVLGD
jgi:hypothetical protein